MSPTPLTKLPGFVEHLAEKAHNLSTANLVLALSNTPPTGESPPPSNSTAACVLSNITQISSYANLSSRALTTQLVTLGETIVLRANNITLTATGSVPTFRWAYVYNQSSTNPANALLGYYDLGPGGVTMASGDTLKITFDTNEGIFTIGSTFSIYYSSWQSQTYGWESLFAVDWWAE